MKSHGLFLQRRTNAKKSYLQELGLSADQLNNLKYEIQNQTILVWNYKGLKSLPSSLIKEASHIQQIYLKHNLLTKLPDNLWYLHNLTFLYLYGNNIEELPNSIGDIKSLNILDLSNNRLKHLNSSITRLINLKSLVVCNNELSVIPAEISKLKSLSLLILTGNRLLSLPETLGKCSSLQGLYVDNNLLQVLPHSLVNLSMLAHLSCCHNYLVNLPSKPFRSNLTLFFDNNQELNYLPFSLLHDLKLGDFFNPFVVPYCGCFLSNPNENQSVKITFKELSSNSSVINLPLQLHSISVYCGFHKLTTPTLFELCLRYFIKNKYNFNFSKILEPGVLPNSLSNYLEIGPVIYCENCQNSVIFTYASIIAISVKIASQIGIESKEIPSIIYFCSDSCAHSYVMKVNTYVDDYGSWLQKSLSSSLNVEIMSSI